ncbi:unhealthy ribosome biogenesis protein 2 homolog [Osmerus eperlanus]|uniref:unhealthy ribosome biogenesis protein 2 homolog n=1 Tax=Osmerus eperlanus TaxID=29151 RepID=UPI002E0E10FB
MTAIYSGIYSKLKNPRTPWEDKLKLARFAWISNQCVLPNKEQVLFDWTSHALTCYYNKKAELPQEVVEGLWTYLDNILHSKRLQHVLSQGKTVSIRQPLAQVIIDRIQEFTSGVSTGLSPVAVSTVLSCCQSILSSTVLAATFTTKYELLVDLLAKHCFLASSKLHQPAAEPPMAQDQPMTDSPVPQPQPIAEQLAPQMFEVLFQVLSSYLVVQKQQGNPTRVFSHVSSHLLQPLLLLRHLLTSRAWTPQDDPRLRQQLSRDIRIKIDAILQSALFPPEHLPAYREELTPAKKGTRTVGKKGPAGKGVLSPVSSILTKLCAEGYCDPDLHYIVKSSSLPLLFKFSLDAYCKGGNEKMLCFLVLTRLVTGLDFDLSDQLTVSEVFQPDNWSLAMLALESLLNLCQSGDIYNVASDRIQHGEAQFTFYRKVVELLLNQPQPGIAAWYRCLKAILNLNHLILEPDLDELLSIAWVDSESLDSRVRKARESLVSAVFQIYTKLRQLPRLFQELLNVLCRPAVDHLRLPLLSRATHQALAACLLDTPVSQSLEVCSQILESIQTFIIPDLEENEDMALKLFSLSGLLFSVLFSVKTLDSSSPMLAVRQTQSVMEEMLQVVNAILEQVPEHTARELWVEKTQEAGLLLRYTWMETNTLFQIHCSKYTSSGSEPDPDLSGPLDSILSLLSDVIVTNSGRFSLSDQNHTPMSRILLKLLTIQHMKKVLSLNELLAQSSTSEILCKATQSIIGKEDKQLPESNKPLWDGQITSVDASSYPVANCYLVTSNLPLLAPYISEGDVSHLACVLLSSLLDTQAGDTAEKHISIPFISRQLLESPLLVETPTLCSALVRSLTQRIVRVLGASDTASVCPPLKTFCEVSGAVTGNTENVSVTQVKGDAMDECSAPQKRLEAVAQELLCPNKDDASVSLSETLTAELLSILQIVRTLNPDGMSSEDFSELFLLLFLKVKQVQPCCDVNPASIVQLLGELLSLMGTLLAGRNSHCVLKIIHGSSLLEATMTALFSHSNQGLFLTLDSSDWLAFLRSLQDFIQSLIHLIIHRKSSVRLNLEKFTTFMLDSEVAVRSASVVPAQSDTKGLFSSHLLLACLTSMGQAMTSAMGKSKPLDETLGQLLERINAVLGPAVQISLQAQTGSLLRQAFFVDVVTGMVRSQLATSPQESNKEVSLSHMPMYSSFCQQILRELCPAPRPMDFLVSSLQFLGQYYCAMERWKSAELDELFVQVLQKVVKLLGASWLPVCEVAELDEPVEELLHHLLARSTPERFHLLLLLLKDGLDTAQIRAGAHREVLSAVILTRLLSGCQLPEACCKALWLLTPQLISTLVFIVQESRKDVALTSDLTVPVLTTLTALLRRGEGSLSNPHHVTIVLGAIEFVPLNQLPLPVYHDVFHAIHETLFAIIQCHPQVMLKAAPIFLNAFYRLVASIIKEGRQKGESDRGGGGDGEELLRCARLVERMYSHVATTAEGFTLLSSFIVAQYVTELQKVTLRPDIKSHLTEGVYRILDMCVERDVKFLSSSLQMGVREVFNDLYSSYTHYHKTQRQGEEKYTA